MTPDHPIRTHSYIPQSKIRSLADIECGSDIENIPTTGPIPDNTHSCQGDNNSNIGDIVIADSSGKGSRFIMLHALDRFVKTTYDGHVW